MPGRGTQERGGLWCFHLRRGAVSTHVTLDVCLHLCSWGPTWCPGSLAGPGSPWVADLTLAPRHLKSHFMETLFTRPLKCYLTEATEQTQATCCMGADVPMNRVPASVRPLARHLASTDWGPGCARDSPYSGSLTNSEGSLGRLIPQGLLALTRNW